MTEGRSMEAKQKQKSKQQQQERNIIFPPNNPIPDSIKGKRMPVTVRDPLSRRAVKRSVRAR